MAFEYAVVVLAIGIASCNLVEGSDKTGGRILGGNITIVKPPHSQPWVIGIAYNYEDRIQCGGTLISKRHVISAAHCEVDYKKDCGTSSRCVGATTVIVGEHDQRIEDGQQKILIKNKYMHPEYRKYDYPTNTDPDMIIYELEEDINNKFAKPANLPKENQEFGLYTVSGWGSMNKARDWSDVLRSVELADLGSDRSCFQIDPSKYICGENQKDIGLGPCGGDSGGPWVSKNDQGEVVLAGVHNSGDCDIDEVPHFAVKVSFPPYLTWIKKVTGINN